MTYFMTMNSHWHLKLNSSSPHEIKCYLDRSELLNLKSKGYGVQLEGWIFHPEQRVSLNPQASFLSFSSGNERQDVFAAFKHSSSLFSGFQGVFYFPQGQKQLDLFFDIVTEEGRILGILCIELESPATRVLQSLYWLKANFNRTDLHAAWQMLSQGEVAKLWRCMQVAVSARQVEESSGRHFLDFDIILPKDAGKTRGSPVDVVDIIVPIFNGVDLLDSLLQSLKKNTPGEYRLILVDDDSTDPGVADLLEKAVEWFETVLVLRNEVNLGFVASVNRGLALSENDVVILNSDTEVPHDWLRRLFAPLRMDKRIASVTPMTNAGSIAGFPEFCQDNALIFGSRLEEVDLVFQRIDHRLTFEVPTGVGFCMAMCRSVLDEVGFFDEELFGKGYGEENDWCQRAHRVGYKNVILPSLFVWHKHGGSFTIDEKQRLFNSNYQKLLRKHPRYEDEVQAFIRQDPLLSVRFLVFLRLAEQKLLRPLLIIIDHEEGGGANTYSNNQVNRESYSRAVVRVTFNKQHNAFRLTLNCQGYEEIAWLKTEDELTRFFNLFAKIDFFYNNLVYYPDPVQMLHVLSEQNRRVGVTLTIAVHDYLAVCPVYVLLNANGVYCDIPQDLQKCRKCLRSNRFSAVPAADINEWRTLWKDVLQRAQKILVFSRSSLEILSRVYPVQSKQVELVPHELQYSFAKRPTLTAGTELHVGVVGSINYQKGAKIVVGLVREMERQGWGRVSVIGKLVDVEISSERLNVTGAYEVRDLPAIIDRSGANIFLVPSVWPETFNYTVSELIALDVPVVCFDIGAPPERVERYVKGRVVTNGLAPEALFDELKSFWEKHDSLLGLPGSEL